MHFNGKTIWGTRFGVPSTKLLVPKTILLLQTLQQWTCSLSLQTKPFKKLTYITERRTLLSTIENIDNNHLDLCEPVLIRTLLFGSNLFEQMLIQMFSMQLLNISFLLKDLMNRFFNENRKFSNKVMNRYILYLLQ